MSGEKKNEDYFSVAPPKRTGWESFKLFLWNGETSEFLGRTASSWGKTTTLCNINYIDVKGIMVDSSKFSRLGQ